MVQAVHEEIETVHLYVVREEPARPVTVLPLVLAAVCLLAIAGITLYSGANPSYEHTTVTVPARFFTTSFRVMQPIIPTGVKTYPATIAHGTLTITNGSAVTQQLPAGLLFGSQGGGEVVTDTSVFVPAGSANGYGVATVSTHAVAAGAAGNLTPLAIDAVYGTSLYIRNLTAFSGGADAYSITIQLPKDRQTALDKARSLVAAQKAQISAILASPCGEIVNNQPAVIKLIVNCRFAVYHVPSYMRVIAVKLSGKNFLVDVSFMPRPVIVRLR